MKKKVILGSILITCLVASLLIFFLKKDNFFVKKNTPHFAEVALSNNSWSLNSFTDSYGNIFSNYGEYKPLRTSSWWKNVVVRNCDSLLFPIPYNLDISKKGFAIGVPEKVVSENAVILTKDTPFMFGKENTFDKCIVKNTTELTATISFQNNNGDSLEITGGKGLPFIFASSNNNLLRAFNKNFGVESFKGAKDKFLIKDSKTTLGVKFSSPVELSKNDSYFDFKSKKNLSASIFVIPNESIEQKLFEIIPVEAPKIETGFDIKDSFVHQFFKFPKKYPFVLLPHQFDNLSDKKLIVDSYSLNSLRGNLKLVYTNNVLLKYPLLKPEIFPQVSLSESEKALLAEYFAEDMKTVDKNVFENDAGVYWRGKILGKYANFLYIAKLLNDEESFKKVFAIMESEISDWVNYSGEEDSKYFSYDMSAGGLLSSRPEYGHEDYNDHHFHYGYWIYALTTMAHYNPEIKDKYSIFVEYLMRDAASFDYNDPSFPYLRHFDLYEGHSMASGLNYFGDGNNQESSSEAINFWYASYLWSHEILNPDMENAYLFGYNLEALVTNTYYFNTKNDSSIFPEGYKHVIASILWEGKYDFATFFSADPNAVHGIQVLPVNFGSIYLKHGDFAAKNIESQKNETKGDLSLWKDTTALYMLINKNKEGDNLLSEAKEFDSGSSKSWSYIMKIYYSK